MADADKNARLGFEQVLLEELKEVECSRRARVDGAPGPCEEPGPGTGPAGDVYRKANDMKLAGLAFSGGGIRSATFNLGVLQGLARVGLLRTFDYLSTVSGGGYIGSWFAAWVKRERSFRAVEEQLGRECGSGVNYREPDAISFLRKYSNYLTPKMGMLTADTWALVAVYLRNLTLNLVTITALFLSVFLVPHLSVWYARVQTAPGSGHPRFLFYGGLLFLAVGVFSISLNQAYWSVKQQRSSSGPSGPVDFPWYTRQVSILVFVVLPVMLSALSGGLWLWHASLHQAPLGFQHVRALVVSVFAGWLGGSIAAHLHANAKLSAGSLKDASTARLLAAAARETVRMVGARIKESVRPEPRLKIGTLLVCMAVSLLVGCGLFVLCSELFRTWTDEQSSIWYAMNFSAPFVLVVYMTIGTLLIGLMGRQLPDESREWWSRLGGWLIICSVSWTALSAISFFSLPVIAYATALVGSGWLASTVSGVLLGKSPATGGTGSKKWIELAAKALPYLFVVGLLMFLSFLTSSILVWTTKGWETFWSVLWLDKHGLDELVSANFLILNDTLDVRLAWMFMAGLGTALLLSWRIDVNQFSIHYLYRNRLMRGYLGASNRDRNSQPFTGFDPDDDASLSDLRSDRAAPEKGYHGPYPIINTALNLVGGKNLAWQTRKSESFFFGPLYSGYGALQQKDAAQEGCCYRPTDQCAKPDGMSLGTAMAISGAAASPNMGYHSSPALAFLLTVFNVRLGWWSGNPRYRSAWEQAGPTIGLWYMMKELFGFTDDESRFVYLSDGGHFENLGIYELVKRRCRFIIACDGGQDRDMKFDDLGNALRKIRVDLGVDITIDVSPLRDGKKHCVLGRIVYHGENGREEYGDLLYIKALLCGKEPADVLNYRSLHKEFPHQTTADQWFDEAQFESYRMLGLHTVLEICERWDGRDVESLVRRVEQYIEHA